MIKFLGELQIPKNGGYRVVLTADRTLMSEYGNNIFLGFSACVPTGLIPDRLYFSLFCPSVKADKDGSVMLALYGTRKVEAALQRYGFQREDVIVACPDHLLCQTSVYLPLPRADVIIPILYDKKFIVRK